MIHLLLLACGPSTGSSHEASSEGDPAGGTGGVADAGGSDEPLALSLAIDEEVATMVRASWSARGGNEHHLEYRVDGGDWQVAPATSAETAVLLGIPEETPVEAVLVETIDGAEIRSAPQSIETGSLPRWLEVPEVHHFDASLADAAPYVMVTVDGGDDYTFEGPWQVMILNREGDVVWYRRLPDDLFSLYAQAAHDGRHVWYDASDIFDIASERPHVVRTTLDGRWSEHIELEDLGQAVDEGPDGSFFYEKRGARSTSVALMKREASGEVSEAWDCLAYVRELGESAGACFMNATNWTGERNTVLTSMFASNTVFEIDLATGQPVRQMGQMTEGDPYLFADPRAMFAYQHYPNYTDEGTLLLSTHEPGVSGTQYAAEYAIDDATKTLTRVWHYESTDIWATQIGEAIRLQNGNTLQGYGQDGGVREVTPDGEEAWFVTWDKNDQGYRPIGHTELIDDLYALNRGPG